MHRSQRGVSLIELLVTIAILGLVLAGIYGLLGSAYQTYLNTRRRIVAQQSARTVLDYLTYRLREVEGGNRPENPWNCTEQCHRIALANTPGANALIPCQINVTSPRRTLELQLFTETGDLDDLTPIKGIPAAYAISNLAGTRMEFKADLLPLTGFSETFSDADDDGEWDWTKGDKGDGDINENQIYDPGETELLDDMNENSEYDCFAEQWGIKLRNSSTDNYYELVEALSFSSISPSTKLSDYNRSIYPDAGYGYDDNIVIADGIVGYRVELIPMVTAANIGSYAPAGTSVDNLCAGDGCHGASPGSTAARVYDNDGRSAGDFNMARFVAIHPWWNVKGIHVEVTTASRKGQETHFVTLSEFVIPRNIEVNKMK
jgi:prepilin-type N-terminal cleavage/methylation domain-containing protein